MKNIKKVFCLAMALVFVMSAVSFSAFAAKTTPTAEITVTADKTEKIANKEQVTVTVSATASEDYYVGPVSIPVTYDATLFDASEATAEDIFGAGTTDSSVNIDSETGKVTVVITPLTSGEPKAPNLNGNETTLYTFKLTAKADSGSCDVAAVNDQKTLSHTGGTLYMGSFDSDDPRTAELTTMGQTLNLEKATVKLTIGEDVAPADLELTTSGTEAGVVIDRTKTFGGQYDGVVSGFTQAATNTFKNNRYITTNTQATNGGSLQITTSDGKSGATGNYGTGTEIQVLNSDGSESKKYVVVIYGDVDKNGLINVNDTKVIKSCVSSTSGLSKTSPEWMAANCADANNKAFMLNVNTADIKAIKSNNSGTKIDAKALAAKHATFNNYA